jgi:hypothetical protein
MLAIIAVNEKISIVCIHQVNHAFECMYIGIPHDLCCATVDVRACVSASRLLITFFDFRFKRILILGVFTMWYQWNRKAKCFWLYLLA